MIIVCDRCHKEYNTHGRQPINLCPTCKKEAARAERLIRKLTRKQLGSQPKEGTDSFLKLIDPEAYKIILRAKIKARRAADPEKYRKQDAEAVQRKKLARLTSGIYYKTKTKIKCGKCDRLIFKELNKTGLCDKCRRVEYSKEYTVKNKDAINTRRREIVIQRRLTNPKSRAKIIKTPKEFTCNACGGTYQALITKLKLCPICLSIRADTKRIEVSRIALERKRLEREANPKIPIVVVKTCVCGVTFETTTRNKLGLCLVCIKARENSQCCPIKKRLRHRRSRAKRMLAEGCLELGEDLKILKNQNYVCIYCNTDLHNGSYHLDHIVPLSKGGSSWVENHQGLCPECNQKKADKLPWDYENEIGFSRDPNFWIILNYTLA